MKYPIYWSAKATEAMQELLNQKKDAIKAGNQGMGPCEVLGDDILQKIQAINPKVTYVSLNYHSCQGKADEMIVATIGVGNNFTNENKINGNIYRGWKIRCSEYSCSGYLDKYFGRF